MKPNRSITKPFKVQKLPLFSSIQNLRQNDLFNIFNKMSAMNIWNESPDRNDFIAIS